MPDTKYMRAYKYDDVKDKDFGYFDFDAPWSGHLGTPEDVGSTLVWGSSGQGKTSYVMQMARMFCDMGVSVHYNTVEEGVTKSFKDQLKRVNIAPVKRYFSFKKEGYEVFLKRLACTRAKVIIVDSVQYFFRKKSVEDYFSMVEQYPKYYVFVSHESNGLPKGDIADAILYHSNVKVRVRDYMAQLVASRCGGTDDFVIWQKWVDVMRAKLLKKG